MLERKQEYYDVDVAILPAIKLKNNRKKTTLQFSFVLFTWPVSPSGIYGTTLLSLVLLTTTAKKRTLKYNAIIVIHVYSSGIAGFVDQQITFKHEQSVIFQSQDCNLLIECLHKIPHPRK